MDNRHKVRYYIRCVTMYCRILSSLIFILFFNIFVFGIKPSRRILGGEDASPGEFPYAAFFKLKNFLRCGGSIISERHILTTCWCVNISLTPPYTDVTVHTGTIMLDHGGESHKISKATLHPNWLKPKHEHLHTYDVAVVTLASRIIFNSNQKAVFLPSEDVYDNEPVVIIGWGRTSHPDEPSGILKKLHSNMYTAPTCGFKSDSKLKLWESQICTIEEKGRGMTTRDHGGSAVNDDGVIIGIANYYDGLCSESPYDVYFNVYSAIDFIMSEVQKAPGAKMLLID